MYLTLQHIHGVQVRLTKVFNRRDVEMVHSLAELTHLTLPLHLTLLHSNAQGLVLPLQPLHLTLTVHTNTVHLLHKLLHLLFIRFELGKVLFLRRIYLGPYSTFYGLPLLLHLYLTFKFGVIESGEQSLYFEGELLHLQFVVSLHLHELRTRILVLLLPELSLVALLDKQFLCIALVLPGLDALFLFQQRHLEVTAPLSVELQFIYGLLEVFHLFVTHEVVRGVPLIRTQSGWETDVGFLQDRVYEALLRTTSW